MGTQNKSIPTEIRAVYRGNDRTVAAEANMKKPDNPEEVIARNTKKVIHADKNEPVCKKQ